MQIEDRSGGEKIRILRLIIMGQQNLNMPKTILNLEENALRLAYRNLNKHNRIQNIADVAATII